MSLLSFLSNQSLASNAEVKPNTVSSATRVSVDKNPTNADIRIFKSGAVYPSLALINQDGLQYLPKDSEGEAYGYDVIDSGKFLNTKGWSNRCIFIAKVDKSKGKVDLFGRTSYNAEGEPTDVAIQGAATFGKDLLEMVETVYGVTIPEGENFMDLKIVRDFPFTTDDGIYWIPKEISRGARKGEIDLVRREDLELFALAPVAVLEQTPAEEDAPQQEAPQGEVPGPMNEHSGDDEATTVSDTDDFEGFNVDGEA